MAWSDIQPIVLGLGAVVLGLIANTLLEWFRLRLAAHHQREATRRALVAELQAMLETTRNNVNNMRGSPPPGGSVMRMPIKETYPGFGWALPTVGLLTGAEISAVFKAYDYMNSWVEIVSMIGRLERVEGRLFGHVGADNCDTILSALEDRERILSAAVSELGAKLK